MNLEIHHLFLLYVTLNRLSIIFLLRLLTARGESQLKNQRYMKT